MSPFASDNLTVVIEERPDGTFAVLRSPDTAEHTPDYAEEGVFPTKAEADAWRLA